MCGSLFLLIASASYLERRRCAFVGVSADVGKRHAPCREGWLSLHCRQTERGAATLTDRAVFWCMCRRQSFMLLCSSSPLSVATGQPCLSFVTPAEPARRPSVRISSGFGVWRKRVPLLILPHFVRPDCLRVQQAGFWNHQPCFRYIRSCCACVFAWGACSTLPHPGQSVQIPVAGRECSRQETWAGRGVSPVCKDQRGPPGRAPARRIAAEPFPVLLS